MQTHIWHQTWNIVPLGIWRWCHFIQVQRPETFYDQFLRQYNPGFFLTSGMSSMSPVLGLPGSQPGPLMNTNTLFQKPSMFQAVLRMCFQWHSWEGKWHMHDIVIKWKHFPRCWPFVWGIHRSPVNFLHKGQWRGASMFSLICARINGSVNNRDRGWWFETLSCSLWRHCNGVGGGVWTDGGKVTHSKLGHHWFT